MAERKIFQDCREIYIWANPRYHKLSGFSTDAMHWWHAAIQHTCLAHASKNAHSSEKFQLAEVNAMSDRVL